MVHCEVATFLEELSSMLEHSIRNLPKFVPESKWKSNSKTLQACNLLRPFCFETISRDKKLICFMMILHFLGSHSHALHRVESMVWNAACKNLSFLFRSKLFFLSFSFFAGLPAPWENPIAKRRTFTWQRNQNKGNGNGRGTAFFLHVKNKTGQEDSHRKQPRTSQYPWKHDKIPYATSALKTWLYQIVCAHFIVNLEGLAGGANDHNSNQPILPPQSFPCSMFFFLQKFQFCLHSQIRWVWRQRNIPHTSATTTSCV